MANIIDVPGQFTPREYGVKLAKLSDIDNNVYGPYESVAAAHTALSAISLNVVGVTVGIIGANNTIVEYWYQGGTSQNNLVEKQQDIDATPTYGSEKAVSSNGVFSELADLGRDVNLLSSVSGTEVIDSGSRLTPAAYKAGDIFYVEEGNEGQNFSQFVCGVKYYIAKADGNAGADLDSYLFDNTYSSTEALRLSAKYGGSEQIQSDWNQTNTEAKDFIKNKPTIPDTNNFATKQEVSSGLAYKVDKETGKGLSTNDYSTTEKNKLANLPTDTQLESALNAKADKATTLAGYGITDAYTKSETYSKTEINDHIDTPNQGYITAAADSNTTTANLKTLIDTAAGSDKEKADFIYRVGSWDGSQYDETVYSEYAWNGTDYIFLSKKSQIDEVFDISAYHANTPYVDLAAALGTNGDNVPQSLRKGGMSVKFIQGTAQSSDNKYVQWRYMGTAVTGTPNPFLDTANWQGVDDEPTAGSPNLVESGGVKLNGNKIFCDLNLIDFTADSNRFYYNTNKVKNSADSTYKCTEILPVKEGDVITYCAESPGSRYVLNAIGIDGTFLYSNSVLGTTSNLSERTYTVPSGVVGLIFCNRYVTNPYVKANGKFVGSALEKGSPLIIKSDPVLEAFEKRDEIIGVLYKLGYIPSHGGFISGSTGVFVNISSGLHKIIPLDGISKVSVVANSSYNGSIAFLKSYTPPTDESNIPDYASGTSVIIVTKGTEYSGNVPSDAKYLCVGISFNGIQDHTPVSLLLDDYDIIKGTIEEIGDLKADLNSIKDELEKSTISIQKTALSTMVIPGSLSVGDTLTLTSGSYLMTDSVLTKGAKGIFITCKGSTTCYSWALVDNDEKVLALGDKVRGNERACYVNLKDYPSAYKLYYSMAVTTNLVSVVYLDIDGKSKNIYNGDVVVSTKSENITLLNDINEPRYNAHFVNDGENNVATFEFSEVIARSAGLWIKCNSKSDVEKIDSIKIKIFYNNTQLLATSSSTNQVVQINDWVFVKLPVRNSSNVHWGDKIDKFTIEITFASGLTSSDFVDLQLSDIVINHFDRPSFIVNFDNQWKATEICGAYDYLLNNNIPFTITGYFAAPEPSEPNEISAAMVEKITRAYEKGIVDIGKYGGDVDSGIMISSSVNMPTLMDNCYSAIEAKSTQGFECVSFGSAINLTTAKMFRALKCAGFKCIRSGMPGGMLSYHPKDKKALIVSVYENYYTIVGSCGTYFTHGVSSNPSGESKPSMYDNYSNFESVVAFALAESSKGGLTLMNMRQYGEQ